MAKAQEQARYANPGCDAAASFNSSPAAAFNSGPAAARGGHACCHRHRDALEFPKPCQNAPQGQVPHCLSGVVAVVVIVVVVETDSNR